MLGEALWEACGKKCAENFCGIMDCGFTGEAVCGERTFSAFDERSLFSTELPPSKRTYRFGEGTLRAIATFLIKVKDSLIFKRDINFILDLVPGYLPLLLGRQFQSALNLMVDPKSGDVFKTTVGRAGTAPTLTILQKGIIRSGLIVLKLGSGVKNKVATKNFRPSVQNVVSRFERSKEGLCVFRQFDNGL